MVMDDKLQTELSSLGLSARTFHALTNTGGFRTLGDVVRNSENELLRIENFGRKSLNELKEVLTDHDLRLPLGATRKYVSFRVSDKVFEKIGILCRSANSSLEVELERIVTDAVLDIPHIGDLAARLSRLEQAVFGAEK